MALLEKAKKHWVSVTLYIVLSLFFLGACLVSTNTYGGIAQAQRDIALLNPQYDAHATVEGGVNISFTVQLYNPSRFTLHVYTLAWYTALVNMSSTTERTIPLGEDYVGPTRYVEVPAKTTVNYSFWAVVDDPAKLAKLTGFINYMRGLGEDYTLETLPYHHEFATTMYIGGFNHDYLRERYLNSLVTVSLDYSSPEVVA
jgi:hypothetical protein